MYFFPPIHLNQSLAFQPTAFSKRCRNRECGGSSWGSETCVMSRHTPLQTLKFYPSGSAAQWIHVTVVRVRRDANATRCVLFLWDLYSVDGWNKSTSLKWWCSCHAETIQVKLIVCDWLISSSFVTPCTLKDSYLNRRTRHDEISSMAVCLLVYCLFFFLENTDCT